MSTEVNPAHGSSLPMVNAKLDLFKTLLTDISTSSYRTVPIQPFTTVTTPIDFQVDAQGDFVDLNRNYFDVELQLSSTDNNNLARTADDTDTMIAPVNNLLIPSSNKSTSD